MIMSTKATAFATIVICAHISIKSTSILLETSYEIRLFSVSTGLKRALLQGEVHGDGHDDRHGNPVQQGRRVLPLLHCVERRGIEQRNRAQYFRVLDASVRANHRFD